MSRWLPLLILSVISAASFAGEVWIFLKDGRVGLGDAEATPIKVRLPDGALFETTKDQIQGQRTRAEADAAVDAMMQEILR